MKLKNLLAITLGLIFLNSTSSKATDDAQTQQLMTNPVARDKAMSNDPKAKQADAFIKNLTGNDPGLTEEAYSLAADVFANIVKDCNGDIVKMKAAMEKFMKNPDQFAATWTEAQKTRLKDLEDKIHLNPAKN